MILAYFSTNVHKKTTNTPSDGQDQRSGSHAAVFVPLAWDQDEQDKHGLSEESRQAIHNKRLSKAADVTCAAFDEWRSDGGPSMCNVQTIVD